MNEHFIIAVDFDGTIVQHQFPRIGYPVPGAFDWMRRFQREGAKLILWTMRCCEGSEGDVLTPAVQYCRMHGVEFWGVNENPQQKESRWSTSGKVYAHTYIDDASAGTPLIESPHGARLPQVDWNLVGPNVMQRLEFFNQIKRMKGEGVYPAPPETELPKAVLIG